MLEKNNRNGYLNFQAVTKKYGFLDALKEVSFSVDEGEIFGYIGPNGAGKTTTIKIIVGLITDFTGDYSIGGKQMPGNISELYKFVGYLPQNVAFQDWRTVNHVLRTFGRLSGLSPEKTEERTNYVLDLFGLTDVRNKKVSKLSGGNIQKVGLAQSLIHDPKVLILDEPLSGLDPAMRKQVKSILKELSSRGTTVFFSSHILSDVQDVADKIGIINRGSIKMVAAIEELEKEFLATREISLHLSFDSDKTKILSELEFVTFVKETSEKKYIVTLKGDADLAESIHLIIQKLTETGNKIYSIAPVSPSLDDLFIKYVNEEVE